MSSDFNLKRPPAEDDAAIPVLTEVVRIGAGNTDAHSAQGRAPLPPAGGVPAVSPDPQPVARQQPVPGLPAYLPPRLPPQFLRAGPAPATAPVPLAAVDPEVGPQGSAFSRGLTEADWEQLEHDVRENVLRSLQSRIDLVLEARIKEMLTDLLEQVLHGMTAELKTSLKDTMRDVVARAVAQELSSTQAKRFRQRTLDV